MVRLPLVLVTALVFLLPAVPQAQEKSDKQPAKSPAGNWKFFLPFRSEGGDLPIWLLNFEEKDGKWTAKILATGRGWPRSTISEVSVSNGTLKFELRNPEVNFPCEFKLTRETKGRLTGVARIQKREVPAELERTKVGTLDEFDLLREELETQPLGRRSLQLAMSLINEAEERKIDAKDVEKWAKIIADSAAMYSPNFQRDMMLRTAMALAKQKTHQKLAVEYVKRAEKMLDPKEPAVAQKRVLDVLLNVYEAAGRAEDGKSVQARIAKLDFSIKTQPFAGRKSKSKRVVLGELFTGAQCPPCVAADLAFDALGKTFKPTELVLLQYHLHVPGPDALTSPDSVARSGFYEEQVRGTPSLLLNGKTAAPGGGGREDAPEKYEEYLNAVSGLLEAPEKANVSVSASQKGEKINITAEVKDLAQTGDDIRLRVVLVEETVNYKGTNGLTVHHQVVRSMPGGPAGTVMKDKATKKTFTVDLRELRKTLQTYLEAQNKKDPFPNKERPLELKKFHVVAFVQNDKNAEILQAAQAPVKAE